MLVVDDDPAIRSVFVAALRRAGHRTLEAASGYAALAVLAADDVDVALLDLEMPGLSGIDLVDRMRADPRLESIGIVLVSGNGELDRKLAGLEAGASDYLVKPVALQELLARVAAQLRDRSLWLARLDRQLAARSRLARRIAELDPTVPLGTIERQLADILAAELPLRRLGLVPMSEHEGATGDTFSIEAVGDAARVRVPLRFAGVSVGILDATVDAPLERALSTLGDLAPQLGALLAGGGHGRGAAPDARRWVDELLAADGLRAVFQPIVSLADGEVVGFEGLTRFTDGTRPDVAFALAAQYEFGARLEVAAIERILGDAHELPTPAWLSVNVSPTTLRSGTVDHLLNTTGRPLVVEVTENEHVDDYAAVRDRLTAFPDVTLAVDDAGAGYASLRHVFELRPDLIKLDRSWIADIDGDPVRQALIRGLIGFSATFDARMVAEGVERPEEARTLWSLGVPLAQGFLFGRPGSSSEAGRSRRWHAPDHDPIAVISEDSEVLG